MLPLHWTAWAGIAAAAWVAFAVVCWIFRLPRGVIATRIGVAVLRVYSRLLHRLRIEGRENLPGPDAGPLIVIANHTAGIDPLLVQAACPFIITWMMAEDMQLSAMRPLWRWVEVISVHRTGRDSKAAREAIRHLRDGGVVGIFPEGGIERPPGRIMPFMPGVGLIIAKTGAPVLITVIRDTPAGPTAWSSLWRPSRSRITFLPITSYAERGMSPAEIADDLRRIFLEQTGWPEGEGWAPAESAESAPS